MLEHCHVVEWAVYTANGKPGDKYATGRIARPVAVVRNGKVQADAPESKPGLLAHMIRSAYVDDADPAEALRDWGRCNSLVAIESASVRHIEGVGILRLAHRADTENTKVWWHDVHAKARETFFFYEQVAKELGVQVSDLMKENDTPVFAEGDISR